MKKDYCVKEVSVSIMRAPLNQPFRTALGQHDSLENVLFCLELSGGVKGYGEAAVATHITGETVKETINNLKLIGNSFIGKDISDYLKLSCELSERLKENKSAIAAIEMALVDALTKQWKIPLWKFFGNSPEKITTDITIVISDLSETEESVRKFYKQGFNKFKVKVGRDQELDYKRVLAVKRLAPKSDIYLDANQGYTARDTLDFLKLLKRAGVTPVLIEQPVVKTDIEGLEKVTRLSGVTVCADESASSLSDVMRIIREKSAGAINIKLMKFGIFSAREVYYLAKANGIKLMIGGMMESSLSMMASAHLAAGLGGFDYIDLDCPFFIKKGYEKNQYLNSRGVYNLKKVKYGIGITPFTV